MPSATGIPAPRIRALAAEIARVAFDEAITLDRPWTDWLGRRHPAMTGRPVAIHAMRGISAHANGFQTARALHLLQILIGAVETPGSFRMKPPYPKPPEIHPRPHAGAPPGQPLDGPHLGYPLGPEHLLIGEDGRASRIDKAFTWDAPLSAHGMMHMVISNAHAGDPYRIDTLFLYMANMAWNSSMAVPKTLAMLTDRDDTGAYRIPHVIVADAYASETVAYADLVLPDTTYLERHDCISILDRPIGEAEAAADAIRWPVVEPDRPGHEGVRGFQSVLLDLGARLGLPGMVEDGRPKFADYADYIQRHERRPGIGPLAGWRGDGPDSFDGQGRGAPNPGQIDAYIANGGFWRAHIPDAAAYFKPWNAAYWDWAVATGLVDKPAPYLLNLWSEPLRRFQMAAEGKGAHLPPDRLKARLRQAMDPLPVWYPPGARGPGLSAARADPAADAHVPFVGLAERLAQADHRAQPDVPADRGLAGRRLCRRRLGHRHLATRADHRAGRPARGPEPADGLDLERHRQAPRRLGAGRRRARGPRRIPDEPPDLGTAARARRRPALVELRSGHRPGRLVRPAGPRPALHRAAGCRRAAVPVALRAIPARWKGGPVMHSHMIAGNDGTHIHVRETGNPDAPPILFIHGWSFSHMAWRRQMDGPLAARHRLLALDIRGHGMSEAPAGHAAYNDSRIHAEDIAAVLATLDLVHPVVVAWSFGGIVLGDFLRHHGDSHLGGILFAAPSIAQGQTRPHPTPDSPSPLYAADHAVMIPAMRGFVTNCAASLASDDLAEFTAVTALVPPHVRLGMLMRKDDHTPTYAAANCPARIVWGDADRLIPRAEIDSLAAAMPRAQVKVYPGIGHMPFHEAADRFDADLAGFVAEVRAAA